MAEQIIIEFIANTDGLAPAVDQLEKLGQIDKATAATFKATNAELAKRQATLKANASTTQAAASSTKKSIDDVDKAVKNLTNDFLAGFQEGVNKALQEAGVSMDEFQAAINGTISETGKFTQRIADLKAKLNLSKEANSFQGLQKQVSAARDRVLQTATALERLRKTGGVDTEKFTELNKELQQQQAELKGIEDQYDAVIASAENYGKATDDVTETVRQRLKEIQSELVRMRVAGENATDPERYRALTNEAGQLQSALGDVADEVARAGSNTGALDSLLQIGGGIAGTFSVGTSAIALFGDESEELQEVLVRVNAAMAIAQGLQQVQALWAARLTVARGLEAAATSIQTAAQTAYNFVVGTSIGLMKAFRIALAATGIGLFVIALIELVSYLSQTAEDLENVNRALERNKTIVEADTSAIKGLTDEYVAFAESRNALESEIIRLRGRALQQERAVLSESNERLSQQRDALDQTSEAWALLNKQIDDNNTAIRSIDRQTIAAGINLEKQLAKERLESQLATTERILSLSAEGSRRQLELQQKLVRDKLQLDLQTQALTEAQRLQLIEAANREQLELRLAFNKRIIDQDVARIEESIRGVEVGTNAELRLRQELIQRQAAAEVQTTRLSEAEKMQIRESAAREVVRLELAFAAEQRRIADEQRRQVREDLIQAAIHRNATALSLAEQGSEQQLQLQLANIELAATQERNAAQDNALRIAEINAAAERQKLDVKRQFAEAAADAEIRIESAKNGRLLRGLQQILTDQRSTFRERIRAANEIFLIEAANIDKQKQNLRDMYAANLISQQEYNVRYAELEDQRAELSDQANQRILESTRELTRSQVQTGIEVTSQLVGVLDSVYQSQANAEQSRIEQQRRNIDELRESGAITEKEAERRRRELEQEERKAQQRQAIREKQIATFRALLAIPQAFLQGTSQGGPILGAIYAAIAAHQAAIVFSTPIPRFGKGKKNSYEGLAEIGETGAELVESGGQMYIAPKKTIVWLGARDKVYNPKETAAMLEKPGLRAAKIPDTSSVQAKAGNQFDYERLGKEISKNQNGLSLNIDGYKNFVINGHSFDTYLKSRRGY